MEDNKEDNLENNNNEKEAKEEEEKKENEQKAERSKLSLEGAKEPLSLYTRRVINTDNIRSYLNEDSTHGLCGGANLGNTCFMNSSIACLSNCIELTCYFLSGDYKKDINKENKLGMEGQLAEHWGDLLQEYWVQHTRVGDPSEFKKIFGEKIKRFKGYEQQDSNEFIDLFLDLLNEDLNSVTKKEYEKIKEKDKDESDVECSKRFWENYIKKNDSIVTDLFCGQIKSTLTCPECKFENVTFDPFNSLNLNIPEEKEEKIQFTFFYVPKYFLRTPIRIIFRDVPKKATFQDLFTCLKNKDDFKYHDIINKLIINKIDERKSLEFIKEEDSLSIGNYDTGFYFCYDIINPRENFYIPIYLKDNKEISQYPRVIMLSELYSTLDDLRKKIYFNIRKLILSPFKKEGEEVDSLSNEINNYKQNIEVKDDYIFGLINKEYKEVFNEEGNENDENNDNDKKNCLKKFMEYMPFKIYLTKGLEDKEEKIFIFEEKNLWNISKEFTELTNIKSYDDSLESLLKIINNYCLIIEFKNSSKYINKPLFKLNICVKNNFDYVEYKRDEAKKKITLKKCLELFSKEEQLKEGNEWNCPNCKKKVLASKKMEIYYTPKILIICFKRFKKSSSFTWHRNDEDIDFPIENMDMKEFIIGPDKDHSVYDLFAVSQHYGGMGFGHYTATCKNLDNWYYYNDSSIQKTNADSVLSPSAYVLFYRRKTD